MLGENTLIIRICTALFTLVAGISFKILKALHIKPFFINLSKKYQVVLRFLVTPVNQLFQVCKGINLHCYNIQSIIKNHLLKSN